MPSTESGTRKPPRWRSLEPLVDERRRRILATLRDRDSPMVGEVLAVRLAAAESNTSVRDVPVETVRRMRAELEHVDLPTFEAAGLIERDAEAGTVTTTDHPLLRGPTLARIVPRGPDDRESVLATLGHDRRRVVLSVLRAREAPVTRRELARTVATHEAADDGDADADTVDRIQVSLDHVHLPRLEDAGVIEYDREADIVDPGDGAVPDEEWLQMALGRLA